MSPFPCYSEEHSDIILRHLSQSLATFVHTAGYENITLGLSGGIDSALVLAIAIDALGRENVHPLFMPSVYTTDESHQCVHDITQAWGISLKTMPIDTLLAIYQEEYKTALHTSIEGIALENVQARIRAMILMTYANINHALVLATGNKSELAVGFCTLYGDTCGALAPIGDIYKTNVYALAKRCAIIYAISMPELLFYKVPSAELAYTQRDDDRLPPYPILDTILYCIERGGVIDEQEFKKEYIEQTQQLYASASFKKKIYPPILSVQGVI